MPALSRELDDMGITSASPRKGFSFDILALAGIVLLGGAVYANTLAVPFYLDDVGSILENPAVRNLQQAWDTLLHSSRGLSQFTFALNYRFGGTAVAGYHLVNIAVHLATAALVYLVLKRVFPARPLLALGGALLFVAHPLQTQAVTYVYQRSASLAGLFFFAAVYAFCRWRETADTSPVFCTWLWYGGALLAGALAVLTKQNTAVLPVALLLLDRYFPAGETPRPWGRLLLCLTPFCLAPALMGVKGLFLDPQRIEGVISNVGSVANLAHLAGNTPLNYLVTQFVVIWIYLRLLVFPWGQALDYDVPIATSLWQWPNLLGLLGIVLLLATATALRRRLPAVSAGIFWFFLALAVESTVIPLDPVFEHRLYVPMFGFVLVVMAGVGFLPRRGAVAAVVALTAALAVLTWQRNALWGDPQAFLEDNLRRAPRNERVHLGLANLYMERGRVAEARAHYEQALAINPGYAAIHANLAKIYAMQGDYRRAEEILREGVLHDPAQFKLYNNLAVVYNSTGNYRAAVEVLQVALRMKPEEPLVYLNLGMAYQGLGRPDQAIPHFRRTIELGPADPKGYFFLGNALLDSGSPREALGQYLAAYRLDLGKADILVQLVLVSQQLGDPGAARGYIAELYRLDPRRASQLAGRMQ